MTFRQFLSIVELRTKIVSLSGVAIGTLAAAYLDGAFVLADFLLLLAAALAADMGTTAFNSYFDFYGKADDPAFNEEEDKVLVHGGVAPGAALLAGLGLFAFAAAAGLALSLRVGLGLALFGAFAMAVGFLYAGGPRPIASTPFGELAAGGLLGLSLPLVAYYVFARRIGGEALALALPSFLFVAAILATNNACDAKGDRAAGRRTLAIVAGPRLAAALPFGLVLAAWAAAGLCLALGLLPAGAAFALAPGLAASALPLAAMRRRGFSHAAKSGNMRAISLAFALYSLSMAASLLVGIAAGTWPRGDAGAALQREKTMSLPSIEAPEKPRLSSIQRIAAAP